MTSPTKSLSDRRDYRFVVLKNGLRVMLIHDAETEFAAAALDVKVGHFSDTMPGLAHFCEHMLFLGTRRFPAENAYSEFIEARGGQKNAYTRMQHTNYFFDVGHAHLSGALDRFSAFFVEPTFAESATRREIMAVNNEHAKNRLSDTWREFQLLKSAAPANHPFAKFGTGSSETLGAGVRAKMLALYKQHYQAQRMTATVVGRESLDELHAMATRFFAEVPHNSSTTSYVSATVVAPKNLGTVWAVVPVRDRHTLQLWFPQPSTLDYVRQHPADVLAYVMRSEHAGSLVQSVRLAGLASAISVGPAHVCSAFSFFLVSVKLTERGARQYKRVVSQVLSYAHLVRRATDAQLRVYFDELARIAGAEFQFKSREPSMAYASEVAHRMHLFPDARHVLDADALDWKFDSVAIRKFADNVRATNALVHVSSQTLRESALRRERWYGTEYGSLGTVAAPQDVDAKLSLPPRNRFTPDLKMALVSSGDSKQALQAVRTEKQGLVTLYSFHDAVFRQPRAFVFTSLETIHVYETARAAAASTVLVRMVNDYLGELLFDAFAAGFHARMGRTFRGLEISVNGYSSRLTDVWALVEQALRSNALFSERRFRRARDLVRQSLTNFSQAAPHEQCAYYAQQLLLRVFWSHTDQLIALADVTNDGVQALLSRIRNDSHISLLVYGDIPKDFVTPFAASSGDDKGASLLTTLLRRRVLVQGVAVLKAGHEWVVRRPALDVRERNSATSVMFQMGPNTPRTRALTSLVAQILAEPFFDQLRTREQLGYLVRMRAVREQNASFLLLLVQSSTADPKELDVRIEAFLQTRAFDAIARLTDLEWRRHFAAVRDAVMKADQTQEAQSARMWSEISTGRRQFDRTKRVATALNSITPGDVFDFFSQRVGRLDGMRRKVGCQVYGAQHESLFGMRSKKLKPLRAIGKHFFY